MHPLDPLSADEITAAADILRREQQLTDRCRYASIELREPDKQRSAIRPRPAITVRRVVCWNREPAWRRSIVSILATPILSTGPTNRTSSPT